MSIAEIISAARELTSEEKRKVAQTLLEDLANEEPEAMFREGQVYHIYTPEFAPGAAAQLAELLKEDADCQ
jgi:hypothetical protein